MTDAYRTSAFMCPVCEHSALREFHGRYVCDECRGMQLATDDFVGSIREIDGSTEPVELRDQPGDGPVCPHCRLAMTNCSLAIGTLEVRGTQLMRCAHHGLWIPRDVMTAAYARASRRGGFHGRGTVATTSARRVDAGQPIASATMIGNMPSSHSGMSAAMASIASAFGGGGGASDGLAIHGERSYRPVAHTLFVSAHKDLALMCPACTTALAYHGDRWTCASCHGVFVENEALAAMVSEMALAPWSLPATTGHAGDRACPICEAPMAAEPVEGVAIDRCDMHGVWFDDHKLQQALLHASTPPHGVGGWLKRLFAHPKPTKP
jgi:Zn-finger nucleic acid-binding protein